LEVILEGLEVLTASYYIAGKQKMEILERSFVEQLKKYAVKKGARRVAHTRPRNERAASTRIGWPRARRYL
jgi:hypothetical protein